MLARFHGRQGDFQMRPVRRGDEHRLHLRVGQQPPVIGVEGRPRLPEEKARVRLQPSLVAVAQRRHPVALKIRMLQQQLQIIGGTGPRSDDAYVHMLLIPFALLR